MKQVSSWLAMLTFAFWGTIAAVALVRVLNPGTLRLAGEVLLPVLLVLGAAAIWFIRRRLRARRGTITLEELRRQSRQRLAGEPVEDAYVVLPSRRHHRHEPFGKPQDGHAPRDHPPIRPDA